MAANRRVFLSYRREETKHVAGRIADRIGGHRVFMDVDTIEPGADFGDAITGAVESCAVLIAIIGRHWVTATDRRGHRKLDDPDDFVVLEIGAALRRGVRVVPVLVDGADMPYGDELPDALRPLSRRTAVRVDHETFTSDVGRLLTLVDDVLRTESAEERAKPAQSKPQTGQTLSAASRPTIRAHPKEDFVGLLRIHQSDESCGIMVSTDGMYLDALVTGRAWKQLTDVVPKNFRQKEGLLKIPLDVIKGELRSRGDRVALALHGYPDVIFDSMTPEDVGRVNYYLTEARERRARS